MRWQYLWLWGAVALTGIGCSEVIYRVPEPDRGPLFGDQAALSKQAAALPSGAIVEYLCGAEKGWMQAEFRGRGEMVTVLLLGLSKERQSLACAAAGAGSECSAGSLKAQFNRSARSASFSESSSGFKLSCTEKPPGS